MLSKNKKSISQLITFSILTIILVAFQNCGGFKAADLAELSEQSSITGSAVTLVWNKTTSNEDNSPASIRGYRLHVGTASEDYSRTVSEAVIGDSAEYRVAGLVSGETYYFSVSAVAMDGTESSLSSEISYTVP